MLNIVNEELMSYSTVVTEEKGKKYTKIKVASSNKMHIYENEEQNNRDKNFKNFYRPNINSTRITSRTDAIKTINREIARVSAPLKNIEEFNAQSNDSKCVNFDLPMSVNVNATNKYHPQVEIRCHEQGDDRANVYIVAFPFNGMIKPIPENPQYRIYKGLIVSSIKPFFFNNRKYRKILYLVIEVNKNLFNADHKYHTNEINIELESYALFDDIETKEKKTNYEKFMLKVLSPTGDYITNWDYDVINEPVIMTAEPGQPLWVTYNNFKNHAVSNRKPAGKNNKPVTFEGNMMVTTNKHGIRKEISMNRGGKKHNKSYNKFNDDASYLDKMMMESGMYDTDYDNRSKKNGGKNRNGNNRGKSRNRY